MAVAVPLLMEDPGVLYWAPLGSAIPSNTVVASVFTDPWPVAWVPLGATEEGSEFSYESKVEAIMAAEFFDPLAYRTVERSGSITFSVLDFTLNQLKRILNGGVITTVSGSGATALSKYAPPSPGNDVRSMIGWESDDNTVRIIMYQTLQGGALKTKFAKAPNKVMLPATFSFEKPAATEPFEIFTAGIARVGA